MAAKILLDTKALLRDTKRLAAGLKSGGDHEAHQQAFRTAGKIGANTPVRTGALLATEHVVQTTSKGVPGWGVTYGSGVRYHYVQNARRKIVKRGMRGCRQEFKRALDALAAREVSKV